MNPDMLDGDKGLRVDRTFTVTIGDKPFVIQVDNARLTASALLCGGFEQSRHSDQ